MIWLIWCIVSWMMRLGLSQNYFSWRNPHVFPKISVGVSLETQSVLTSRHGPEGIRSVKVTCFSPMSRGSCRCGGGGGVSEGRWFERLHSSTGIWVRKSILLNQQMWWWELRSALGFAWICHNLCSLLAFSDEMQSGAGGRRCSW